MAKQNTVKPIKKPEPMLEQATGPASKEGPKAPNPIGVKLTHEELDTLDRIAESNHVKRSILLREAVRLFIGMVEAGEVEIQNETTPTFKGIKRWGK